MKAFLVAVTLAVLMGAAANASPPQSCDIQGSWIGEIEQAFGGGKFLSSYQGRTRLTGTTQLQFTDLPPDPFGAVAITESKGGWQRTGRRTFEYKIVTVGLDEAGGSVYMVVNSGTKTLSEDCNEMFVEAYIQYFTPDGEPLTECIGPLPANASRIDPAPSCPLPE